MSDEWPKKSPSELVEEIRNEFKFPPDATLAEIMIKLIEKLDERYKNE